MSNTRPLPPGATLGVLGGGQLGRMFVHAAQTLGFDTLVLDPDGHSPAGAAAHAQLCAPYDDARALAEMAGRCDAVTISDYAAPGPLRAFAAAVDVISFEFENISADGLDLLASLKPVRPAPSCLRISQDRVAEKSFLNGAGVPTAPWSDCEASWPRLGLWLLPPH